MKKALFIVVLLGIISFVIYKYNFGDTFLIRGSVDVVKVAIKAAEAGDPSLCTKLKVAPLAVYDGSSMIPQCYYNLAVYSHNNELCKLAAPAYDIKHCQQEVDSGTSTILCEKVRYSGAAGEWNKCMYDLQMKAINSGKNNN